MTANPKNGEQLIKSLPKCRRMVMGYLEVDGRRRHIFSVVSTENIVITLWCSKSETLENELYVGIKVTFRIGDNEGTRIGQKAHLSGMIEGDPRCVLIGQSDKQCRWDRKKHDLGKPHKGRLNP